MPITAKLSRKFYERLGDEVTNELVDWLNAVDQSYRQEFRELFDTNFGRLEARLDAALAEMRAQLSGVENTLRAELAVRFERQETRLIRWMFGFWIGSWVAMIGTLVALRQLWGPIGR